MNTYKHLDLSNNQLTIDCKDIILREYKVEDLDEMVAITHEPEVIEFLPDWNAPKEQRLDWLVHYEIAENSSF
ncbi:hypothetical protein [Paenibacillus glacialis]|uniref:hypothetical protein n=1 Tax=Paenibacillus glacialis TaxID=494026 RepID=UPI000AB1C1A2